MMQIALVDDSEEFLNILLSLVRRYFLGKKMPCKIDCFQNPELFYYEIMERDCFDICFLDIEMPQMNGVELAKKIRQKDRKVSIVFLTAHTEFSRAGYEVKAFDYLLKDILREELPPVMTRLLGEIEENRKKYYIIETNSRLEKLFYRDIIYIYKTGQYARFVMRNGETQERRALKEILEKLHDEEFLLVERGFIVNLEHVCRIFSRNVVLSNGVEIRVSKEHIHELKSKIQEYWLQGK